MIKVLVVDDSAFMRKALSLLLEKDPEIRVAATAHDGVAALELIPVIQPDVVTLDLEMPRLDGLGTLRRIMRECPCAVLVVSSLSQEGAEITLQALAEGAVDFIPKPHSTVSLNVIDLEKELIAKVHAVARRKALVRLKARVAASRASAAAVRASAAEAQVTLPQGVTAKRDVVLVGVSTGGPPAVQKLLSGLPPGVPASILVAQHMPAAFTAAFARRLNDACSIRVVEGRDGETLEHGTAYIAPGGRQMRIALHNGMHRLSVSDEPAGAVYKPSANVLFSSAGGHLGRRSVGVVLTGMGADGLDGARVLKMSGGIMLAEDEASCVVYGMPKAVVEAGLVDAVVDINAMAHAIGESLYK